MDLDFNKSSEKDHFYTKLREKYKSEIRKNKNCELFKFKRLAFQLISTTQTSASLSQTQQAIDIALSELNAPNQSSEKIAKQLLFLRKHTSEQPNNLKTTNYLLEIGFGDVLNKFLIDYQNYNIEIHQELLWLVCNLSYLDAKDTPQLKRTDFVDFLKKSLCLKNYKQLEMVFWGLNNLSDDSVECREKIVKEGVVTIIREQILSSNMVNIETLKNYFTLLHSISKGEQDFYFEEVTFLYSREKN